MFQITWITSTTLTEVFLLLLAFVLSACVGAERQRRSKSAGLRTHTLVGLGAAVFTLVSAYGFSSVAGTSGPVDPSRIAAQVVSGIGFLGAGVVFVRQNAVTGLTTAASIWGTAAIGMACGAGMPVIAIIATVLQLSAVSLLGFANRWIRVADTSAALVVRYREGEGALRAILAASATQGFEAVVSETTSVAKPGKPTKVEARIEFRNGSKNPAEFADLVGSIPGVTRVRVAGPEHE